MIPGVGHIKVADGIKGDGPRIIQFTGGCAGPAEDLERMAIGIEYLNSTVAKFAYELKAGTVDLHVIRITQLPRAGAGFAVGAEEFPVRIEYLDAMVAGIGDVEAILRVEPQTFRAVELSGFRAS